MKKEYKPSIKEINLDRIFVGVKQDEIDQLNLLHMYMVDPDHVKLSDSNLRLYEDLKTVFAILSENISHMSATKAVLEAMPFIDASQARSLIYKAKSLYGSFNAIIKDFDRAVLAERYLAVADRCKQVGLYKEEKQALDSYMKLLALTQEKEIEKQAITVPEILFTSDFSAIQEAEIIEEDEKGLSQ